MGPARFPNYRKNQLELLVLVVVALIQAQTVRHTKLAEQIAGAAQLDSVVRRLERFFARHPVTQADIAPLIVSCLSSTPKLTLILDRTHWKLGQADLNVLVLSVLYGKTAIPLLWECLPHSGNSSSQTRSDLLEDLFTLLSPARVEVLLADREFVGKSGSRPCGTGPCRSVFAFERTGPMGCRSVQDFSRGQKTGRIKKSAPVRCFCDETTKEPTASRYSGPGSQATLSRPCDPAHCTLCRRSGYDSCSQCGAVQPHHPPRATGLPGSAKVRYKRLKRCLGENGT